MAESRIYVRVRGRVIGPFDFDQLRTMRDRGQFRRFHEVSEDRRHWRPAGSLVELFAAEGKKRDADTDSEESQPPAPGRGRASGDQTPAEEAAEWFYVGADGKQQGPITRDRLLAAWKDSTITSATLVWRDGLGDWMPASARETGLGLPGGRAERSSLSRQAGKEDRAGPVSLEVFPALKGFLADPVAGLPGLCEASGPGGALGFGLLFCALFDFCWVLAMVLIVAETDRAPRAEGLPPNALNWQLVPGTESSDLGPKLRILGKVMLVAVLPTLCLAAAIAFIRLITSGSGNLGFDVCIASCALLPLGLVAPVVVVLGPANLEVSGILGLLVFCLTILILNSGFTRVLKLSDRGAILCIPASLLLTGWLSKVVVSSVVLR
jgi:hypothetical protein